VLSVFAVGAISVSLVGTHHANHRFEQAGTFARGTPARLGQLVCAEHEIACLASRRYDFDLMPGRARGPQGVLEVLFSITAGYSERSRQ
jgi:hypothetical protein